MSIYTILFFWLTSLVHFTTEGPTPAGGDGWASYG